MMVPQLTGAVRIFVCTKPADMRKGFDGLSGMVQEFLGQDPLSGHLFLFFNKRRDRAKILFWDRDGLLIVYKRLEAGSFQNLDPTSLAEQQSALGRPRTVRHRLDAHLEWHRFDHRSTTQAVLACELIFRRICSKCRE